MTQETHPALEYASTLGRNYSEYIDKVIAHAASEFGVVFHFRADEREAVRYRPARAKRREAEEVAA